MVGATAASAIAALLMVSPTTGASAPNSLPESRRVSRAERFGVQQVPKDVASAPNAGSPISSPSKGANPMIALLPDPSRSDYAYWRAVVERGGKARAAEKAQRDAQARQAGLAVAPLLVDEQEPDQTTGGNDSVATAQFIPDFGSAAGERPVVRILGTLASGPPPFPFARAPEDNGSIPLARTIPLSGASTRASTTGVIGDGPHGSNGDGTGDYDFYELAAARAGQRFSVDIDTADGFSFDSMVAVWDSAGTPLALNDDDGQTFDSRLTFTIPRNGDYFASVAGFPFAFPDDPFDSGSGPGVGSEGAYSVIFGLDADDTDFYSVDLQAGDVIGGSVTGAAADIALYGPKGVKRVGSRQDLSFIYPPSSPLPGGGNAVLAHVAVSSGRHFIAVGDGAGNYDITLEVYRSGPESIGNAVPTIFLDFDGARVNTGIFGGPGVRQLSPLRAFLGRWGLTASQENALINRIVSTTTENLKSDFGANGVAVNILNSRDHADPFGQPNVSRIIVGGTIAESGIPTIGIAQSIDPGNFELEETALVLLDVLSDPASFYDDPNPSLNAYLTPQSNRVRFVGTAIGNVVSHEAGHYLGSFHVDQFNSILNLMDQGGNFPLLFGVGADGVGGTADDRDVDFGNDYFNPFEGFVGLENTAAYTKWGLSALRVAAAT